MVEGSLHFHPLLKLGCLWRQQLPLLSSGVTFALILHVSRKPENARRNFEFSVDFFTTCQLPQCQRRTCHHTLSPRFSSCSCLLPQHHLPCSLLVFDSGSLSSSAEDSRHHSQLKSDRRDSSNAGFNWNHSTNMVWPCHQSTFRLPYCRYSSLWSHIGICRF